MSKSNALENGILELIFKNTTFAAIGDATGLVGSTVDGDLYVSLHTGDPDEAGDQTANETAYENYARVAVARDGAEWTVSANSVSPASDVTFPEAGPTSPGADLTHFGIGTAASGAGVLLYSGTLTPNIAMADGVTPIVKSTSTVTED